MRILYPPYDQEGTEPFLVPETVNIDIYLKKGYTKEKPEFKYISSIERAINAGIITVGKTEEEWKKQIEEQEENISYADNQLSENSSEDLPEPPKPKKKPRAIKRRKANRNVRVIKNSE